MSVRVELGNRYRDEVSGWEGLATAIFEYLHGCRRIQISGVLPTGEPKDFVFDEPQLLRVPMAESEAERAAEIRKTRERVPVHGDRPTPSR